MPLITEEREYKFDVAFSFLKDDLPLALEISDLLQDRISTFIFTDRQDEIIGQDGMTRFPEVFGKEARIVVVLFREAWGTTPWTRVEQDAIRDRVLLEGPDFTVFISLDKKKPAWLTRTQLWYDYAAFGAKGAAGVVSHRVTEYGGMVREETLQDRAARHKRELGFQKELVEYIQSLQAVDHAQEEFRLLCASLKESMQRMEDHALGYSFAQMHRPDSLVLYYTEDIGLAFEWNLRYSNSLNGSRLVATIDNVIRFDRFKSPSDRVVTYSQRLYTFTASRSKQKGWAAEDGKDDFISTDELIQAWVSPFLDRVQKVKLKKQRERLSY